MSSRLDGAVCGANLQGSRCRGCQAPVGRRYDACPKCGSDDLYQSTCRASPMPGGTRCYHHGGHAPQVLRAIEQRDARQRAWTEAGADFGRLLTEMDFEAEPNILDGLPEAYRRAWLMVSVLGLLVEQERSPTGLNRHDEMVVHPLVSEYGLWLDRWTRIQKIAFDVGLEARRQAIEEANVDELFAAVTAALGVLPAEQRDLFKRALAEVLRGRDDPPALRAG